MYTVSGDVSLQIFTNGYITCGLEFDSRNPIKLSLEILSHMKRIKAQKRGIVMLAPFWTDNDATYGDVYYHIYDLNNAGPTSTDLARVQVCRCVSLCQLLDICSTSKI